MHKKNRESRIQNPEFRKLKIFILLLSLCLLSLVSAFKSEAENIKKRFSETRLLMGTVVEVIVISDKEDAARKSIAVAFSAMERVDRLMSNFKEDSDISRINKGAGSEAVEVDSDVVEVIKKSIYYSEISDGAFDITIGGVEELYDFEDKGRIPEKGKFKNSVNLVGYKSIIINGNRVRLVKKGMKLDLGGIAKGYAIDKGIDAIRKNGVADALINAGGDIRAIGESENGQWKVGVLHPRENGKLKDTLLLKNLSVATSGDYRKYFISGGKRYHHILNPSTGLPTEGVQSVTIIAPFAVDSDALATAVFVLGKKRGMELIEKLKDVEGIIIDSDGLAIYSSGVKKYIHN
ncbi:MAG: FAD:protein FMN transferase [Nitrospinae bacterium]|nr:FAD:protein FMN transferase [Nitrospinota bacterium]